MYKSFSCVIGSIHSNFGQSNMKPQNIIRSSASDNSTRNLAGYLLLLLFGPEDFVLPSPINAAGGLSFGTSPPFRKKKLFQWHAASVPPCSHSLNSGHRFDSSTVSASNPSHSLQASRNSSSSDLVTKLASVSNDAFLPDRSSSYASVTSRKCLAASMGAKLFFVLASWVESGWQLFAASKYASRSSFGVYLGLSVSPNNRSADCNVSFRRAC